MRNSLEIFKTDSCYETLYNSPYMTVYVNAYNIDGDLHFGWVRTTKKECELYSLDKKVSTAYRVKIKFKGNRRN